MGRSMGGIRREVCKIQLTLLSGGSLKRELGTGTYSGNGSARNMDPRKGEIRMRLIEKKGGQTLNDWRVLSEADQVESARGSGSNEEDATGGETLSWWGANTTGEGLSAWPRRSRNTKKANFYASRGKKHDWKEELKNFIAGLGASSRITGVNWVIREDQTLSEAGTGKDKIAQIH